MDDEGELRAGMHRAMRGVDPPVTELVSRAVRKGRSARRSSGLAWAGAAAAAAAVVVGSVALTRPWVDPGPAGAADPTGTASAGSCTSAHEAVLPTWAREGFGDPEPEIAHVLGDEGRVVAILFGRVLHAPPAEEVDNKILWVARSRGADPLRIEARPRGTTGPCSARCPAVPARRSSTCRARDAGTSS